MVRNGHRASDSSHSTVRAGDLDFLQFADISYFRY